MDSIQRLRQLGLPFNPPAASETLTNFSRDLGVNLPAELAVLYKDHDGVAAVGPLCARLLSTAEVREAVITFREFGWIDRGFCPFWTDDQSNYAGTYLSGPLHGKVCLIDHEEPDLSPRFTGTASYLEALLAMAGQPTSLSELRSDYPVLDPNKDDPRIRAADEQVVRDLMQRFTSASDPENRVYLAFCVIALMRPDNATTLIAFAKDEDMYVQERACELLGLWKYKPAISLLGEIAVRGTHNGSMAAIRALGRIGSADSRNRLLELVDLLPKGFGPYLGGALRDCGCEVNHDQGNWRFRIPGESNWRAIQ